MRLFMYFAERGMGTIKWICAAVIFMVVLQVVHSFRGKPTTSKTTPTATTASSTGASAATTGPISTTPTNPQQPQQTVVPTGPTPSEIRGQLQAARDRLVESSVRADNALQTIAKWNAEIPPVLTTDAGDNIAADKELVASLTKIVEAKRTSEAEVKSKKARITTIRTDIGKRATSSSPTPLTSAEQEEIDKLEVAVSKAADEWANSLDDARAVIVLGDGRAQPNKKRSLQDEIKFKAAENRLAKLERQLKEEKARREAEAEDRREQEKLDAELKREQEKLAAKQKAAAQAAAAEQKRKEEALIAKARSTEVQSALAPFLYKRGVQPEKSGGGSIKLIATYDSQPMSLSALRSIGALGESTDGLKWLARVGGNRKMKNGPRWGIYSQPNSWSEDDKKLLKQAQQYLNELGPTLVKEGLLSP